MPQVIFFALLSAYSWGTAYLIHVVDWTHAGMHRCDDGQMHEWDAPNWYALPLAANILSGYGFFLVYGLRRYTTCPI